MTIRLGQIGVGYWGPNLLRNFVRNDRCEVAVAADVSSERRDYVQERYPHVSVTGNAQEVIEDSDLEAVVIATPARTHFELTMQALEAGKHVLVEKPMGTTVAEIEEIEDAAERTGRVAMAGHTFVYNPAVRYLKRLLDSGELGAVRYIYSQRLNLGRIRSDIGAVWNFAPHDVSIIQYLLDEPEAERVECEGMSFIQEDIEDVAFLTIEYPDRILANIHVSWLDPKKIRRMTVVGTEKMVVYDDVADNKIAIYDKGVDKRAVLGQHMDYDDPDRFELSLRDGDVVLPKIDFKEPLSIEADHFLDCIDGEADCLTDTRHAARVTRILSTAA